MGNGWISLLAALFVPWWPFLQKAHVEDPRMGPIREAANAYHRLDYGFMPFPTQGPVDIEAIGGQSYDLMLHFYGKAPRTIAFRKVGASYRWISEQQIFYGPKRYETVDGPEYEELVIDYEIAKVTGTPPGQLSITYSGPETASLQLNLAQALNLQRRWGYRN